MAERTDDFDILGDSRSINGNWTVAPQRFEPTLALFDRSLTLKVRPSGPISKQLWCRLYDETVNGHENK